MGQTEVIRYPLLERCWFLLSM